MSSAPKRSHEEGGGHSSASKFPPEDAGPYPKVISSTTTVSSEYNHHPHPYPHAHSHSHSHPHPHPHPHPHSHSQTHSHPPFEIGQDTRIVKPRPESRDMDRRSPMHSIYRVPSLSSNEAHFDSQMPASESRSDSKDVKDARDLTRDNRIDARELFGEAKRDSQIIKGDREVRSESRVDDNKETRCEKDNFNDQKGDLKTEKDGYGHFNWKEPKDYHRGKRYSDAPTGNADPWNILRNSSQGPAEGGKEGPSTEERDYLDANEAVGENKFDLKNEDRYKEKDRKRKDGMKHRDWGDRDKERSDRRGGMPVGNTSSECKESAKEERDPEKWERERKDLKDKERLKEREKDHIKRESWSGPEKEVSHSEKELGDGSAKIPGPENPVSDQKRQKDIDSWKISDKEPRDKRRERDTDAEGDRPEKRSKCYDKESDDGCTEGDGATEKEKENFNYGVQQRKRMLRPRGSPQLANREPRFRPRAQDNEGSQGKSEMSSVVYKVGECMQELIKTWKEYKSLQADKNSDFANNGPTLEIRIPAEHVTATNRQVRGGQLWGTDTYTDDSDLVAVLMHTGYCRPTASPPPSAIQELRATVRVLPPQDSYTSKLRNNVRSRAWGAGIGCSYRVERCCIVKKGGGTIDLEPCLTHSSTVEPTLAPVAVERTMTTRAAASNALRQQRYVREVTIQYNLCNEPWIKYSISIVADKGLKKPLFTSARLKKGEVLYLETHSCRYELCFMGEKMVKATQAHEAETEKSQNHQLHSSTNGEKSESDNIVIDVFRWSRCKKPLPQKVMQTIGIPLPTEHVEVLEENIDWEDVQWSQTGVWIGGKEYTLARVHFLSFN